MTLSRPGNALSSDTLNIAVKEGGAVDADLEDIRAKVAAAAVWSGSVSGGSSN